MPDWGLGYRIDDIPKGPGFASFGLPDGDIVTELSLGTLDNLFPAVYENIPPWDLATLMNVAEYGYDPLQYEVFDRAYEQSLVRQMLGLSPFWMPHEPLTGLAYRPR